MDDLVKSSKISIMTAFIEVVLHLTNSSLLCFKEAAIKVVGTLPRQDMFCPERSGYQEMKHSPAIMKQEINAADREPEVSARKVMGRVVWLNVQYGYGFINWHDTKKDVFVHYTPIKKNNPRKYFQSLETGETFEFYVVNGEKVLQASYVTGPGGVPVQGSRYTLNHKDYWHHPHCRGPPRKYQQSYQYSEGGEEHEEETNVAESENQSQTDQKSRYPPYYFERPYGLTEQFTDVPGPSESLR
ncbi:Y-box-binding protein 1-like [Pseudophryne corroboree]|uniref:Y-box-binding protein 1-like n=1 Tax=Pseudophryne corroboree TaxID=495146 RepID=UPI0030818332